MDQETNERHLEAGAMVLADRGVVCIDEFDKMSDMDRTAIHEVMEQGRVTIAKAGIHAKLNARCSVLAAANPVYGRYDEYKPPMDNIGMQDSLLSRFDLIFVVLDEMDPEHDRRVSDHVLRIHRYRNEWEKDGEAMSLGGVSDTLGTGGDADTNGVEEEEDMVIFDKHNEALHGQAKDKKYVSKEFMRKYIHVARALKPVLTRDACDLIALEYTKLRGQESNSSDKAKTQPVTARTLETLIRLSTAHAKARMSKRVEKVDAESAIELVNFAYFKKVLPKPKKKKDKDQQQEDDDVNERDEPPVTRKRKRKTSASEGDPPAAAPKPPKKKPGDPGYDPYEFDSDDDGGVVEQRIQRSAAAPRDSGPFDLSVQRLAEFRGLIHRAFSDNHSQSLTVDQVNSFVNVGLSQPFTTQEMNAALDRMQEANQVMVSDGVVFLI
jgi:DNA replication licensing factor MCM3